MLYTFDYDYDKYFTYLNMTFIISYCIGKYIQFIENIYHNYKIYKNDNIEKEKLKIYISLFPVIKYRDFVV